MNTSSNNLLGRAYVKDQPVEPTTAAQMLRECAQATWDFKEQRDAALSALNQVITVLRDLDAPLDVRVNMAHDAANEVLYSLVAAVESESESTTSSQMLKEQRDELLVVLKGLARLRLFVSSYEGVAFDRQPMIEMLDRADAVIAKVEDQQ